ncbi:ADP ribosylation factor-like 2 isoform X2 [Arctopsyche grandis]|uniref:ADP ribosylation factor-like 2 isoform X2 n=1 Tax=Arctopsyche grandis TaxID=121162 RepID=UPI00406D8F9F
MSWKHISEHVTIQRVNRLGVLRDLPFIRRYVGDIMSPHITNAVRRARAVASKLYPLCKPNSKLSLKNKCLLYKSIIRPQITYASPVWAHTTISNRSILRLQTVQNKFLRAAGNYDWYTRNTIIHNDLNIDYHDKHVHKLAVNYFKSLGKVDNPLINSLSKTKLIINQRPIDILKMGIGLKSASI